MNQLALQFNIYRRPLRLNVIHFVLLGVLVLALTYVFLVQRTVTNAIVSEGTRVQISELASGVGELESRYLGLSAGVTVEKAEGLGFQSVLESKYLARPSLGTVLSLDNEI